MKTQRLFRPLNRAELDLIQANAWKAFPPRLPSQPIFYPVLQEQYAIEITQQWNLPRFGQAYVVAFDIDADFVAKYPIQKVGLDHHLELWVPAEELDAFNQELVGPIKLTKSYQQDHKVKLTEAVVVYLMNYGRELMTKRERELKHYYLIVSKREHGSAKMAAFIDSRFVIDKATQEEMKEGYQAFAWKTAGRILAEEKVINLLNFCPQCHGLARTPLARQCRHCAYDWH